MRGYCDSDPKCGYEPPKDGSTPTFYGRLQPPAMPILGARPAPVARELQEKERGGNTSDNRGEQSSQA